MAVYQGGEEGAGALVAASKITILRRSGVMCIMFLDASTATVLVP
jgi:hypothetical protein